MAVTARFAAAKAALRAAVAGVVPTVSPHQRFVCIQNARAGRRDRLEELTEGERFFEVIAGSLPTMTPGTCRHEVAFFLRIRYERGGDVDIVETKILEDIAALNCTLKLGTSWDQANTGITAVRVGEPDAETFPSDDDPQFTIIAIPLETRIRSC